jgi:putative ABC transport system permease protein
MRALPYVKRATGMASYDQQTAYVSADNTIKVDVVGILAGFLDGLNWPVQSGKGIDAKEEEAYARVCVITDGVAKQLFPDKPAVGEYLTVVGKPYQVVGVLKKRKVMGIGLGFDWDKSIFIPMGTAEKREGLPTQQMVLVAFTDEPEHNPTVVQLGTASLLARHNGVADFQSVNFGEMLSSFYQFFQAVNLIVAVIAAISLFAGGIGVMNIMLVSVTERVREIGIRKALGASIPSILFQFLGEATVLSTLGGVIGIVSGLGIVALAHIGIGQWSEFWVAHYSVVGVALAMGVTTGIGLFFGAVPAYQAARLDIVECLRR